MPFPARLDPDTIGTRALAFVESRGEERWSLREVAAHLGVTPNALYRYVDGKAGLDIELGAAAARALIEELRAANGEGDDRVVDLAHRYVRFAMTRPVAFASFVDAKPMPDHPRIGAWMTLWLETSAVVARVLPDSTAAAAFALWALIHGRSELARGPARLAAPTAGLDVAVRALLDGYRSLGVVESPLPAHVPVLPDP